jgi:hypothetical protein
MEQRRLRLGDTLDDYCPRERRVTNHAVVAMIEEDIKQTRCTTCDAEHAYKGAKVPRRRKKETSPAALYGEVLAGMSQPEGAAPIANGHLAPPRVDADPVEMNSAPEAETPEPGETDRATTAPVQPEDTLETTSVGDDESASGSIGGAPAEDGPVHRPLIRATLPRPEGQKDTRPVPEFTIRQPGGRGNGFRGGDPRMKTRQGYGGNGNRAHGGSRFGTGAGSRGAGRGGPSAGFRGQGQPRQGGGRKRSR